MITLCRGMALTFLILFSFYSWSEESGRDYLSEMDSILRDHGKQDGAKALEYFLKNEELKKEYFEVAKDYFGDNFTQEKFDAFIVQLKSETKRLKGLSDRLMEDTKLGKPFFIDAGIETSGLQLDSDKWNTFLNETAQDLRGDAKPFLDVLEDDEKLQSKIDEILLNINSKDEEYLKLKTNGIQDKTEAIDIFEEYIKGLQNGKQKEFALKDLEKYKNLPDNHLTKKHRFNMNKLFKRVNKIKKMEILKSVFNVNKELKSLLSFHNYKLLTENSHLLDGLNSGSADTVLKSLEDLKSRNFELSEQFKNGGALFKDLVLDEMPNKLLNPKRPKIVVGKSTNFFSVLTRKTIRGKIVPVGSASSLYEFRPIPRRFHGIFKGVTISECVGGGNCRTLHPERWGTVAIPETRIHYVENRGKFSGATQMMPGNVNGKVYGSLDNIFPKMGQLVDYKLPDGKIVKVPFFELWLKKINEKNIVPSNWDGLIMSSSLAADNAHSKKVMMKSYSYSIGEEVGKTKNFVHIKDEKNIAKQMIKGPTKNFHGYAGNMISDGTVTSTKNNYTLTKLDLDWTTIHILENFDELEKSKDKATRIKMIRSITFNPKLIGSENTTDYYKNILKTSNDLDVANEAYLGIRKHQLDESQEIRNLINDHIAKVLKAGGKRADNLVESLIKEMPNYVDNKRLEKVVKNYKFQGASKSENVFKKLIDLLENNEIKYEEYNYRGGNINLNLYQIKNGSFDALMNNLGQHKKTGYKNLAMDLLMEIVDDPNLTDMELAWVSQKYQKYLFEETIYDRIPMKLEHLNKFFDHPNLGKFAIRTGGSNFLEYFYKEKKHDHTPLLKKIYAMPHLNEKIINPILIYLNQRLDLYPEKISELIEPIMVLLKNKNVNKENWENGFGQLLHMHMYNRPMTTKEFQIALEYLKDERASKKSANSLFSILNRMEVSEIKKVPKNEMIKFLKKVAPEIGSFLMERKRFFEIASLFMEKNSLEAKELVNLAISKKNFYRESAKHFYENIHFLMDERHNEFYSVLESVFNKMNVGLKELSWQNDTTNREVKNIVENMIDLVVKGSDREGPKAIGFLNMVISTNLHGDLKGVDEEIKEYAQIAITKVNNQQKKIAIKAFSDKGHSVTKKDKNLKSTSCFKSIYHRLKRILFINHLK